MVSITARRKGSGGVKLKSGAHQGYQVARRSCASFCLQYPFKDASRSAFVGGLRDGIGGGQTRDGVGDLVESAYRAKKSVSAENCGDAPSCQ